MGSTLTSVGYAYPAVGNGVRADLVARLGRASEVPAGAFVLSTCLRAEVVVEGGEAELQASLRKIFGEPPDVAGAEIRQGPEAVLHLFRLAAGLESAVRGEREVFTQFRQAVDAFRERGGVDGMFLKLLESAVSSARTVRDLLPPSPHASMAALAAQVVGPSESVAVFGFGTMASTVVEALLGLPAPPRITVVARRPDRVTPSGVDVWPMSRAADAISSFPAVVSATSAKARLVPDEVLGELLAARPRPLTLVDLAVPPDFNPPSGARVTYIDIDGLAALAGRSHDGDGADEAVAAAAAEAFHRFTVHDRVGPVIRRLTATSEEVVERVVERFSGRLGHTGDEAVLRQAAHTVARTLLARPLAFLNGTGSPEAIAVVSDAFALGED